MLEGIVGLKIFVLQHSRSSLIEFELGKVISVE